jgi:hypothetical protein
MIPMHTSRSYPALFSFESGAGLPLGLGSDDAIPLVEHDESSTTMQFHTLLGVKL